MARKANNTQNTVNGKKKKKKGYGILQKHPLLRTFLSILLVIICVGVISGGSIAGYVFNNLVTSVNGELIVDLDDYKSNQSRTSFIYAYDNDDNLIELYRLHGEENRIWVDIDKMPKSLINAFVALEDKRFNDHKGVDWYRTVAVVVEYRFSQGGSTITQQLIKNLTGENGRTFSRKYKEIVSALNLEKHYNKNTIIEAYLNTVYLGEGCYGVETASEMYFGKEVSELNAAECACLASITQAPYTYDPLVNPEDNRTRQLMCLRLMNEQGYFETEEDYDAAVAYEMVFTNSDDYVETDDGEDEEAEEDEPVVEDKITSYYIDYVIDSVINDFMKEYNLTYYDAWRKVYYGGLKIYTAVDLDIQEELERQFVNRIPFISEKDTEDNPAVQASMTIMDYSGRVVAIVGGAGEKTENRSLNRATDSPRQPGSSVKPLSVYAPGLEEGVINYSSMIQNYGIVVSGGSRWPQNYGGSKGSPSSYTTVQYAVAQSLNTVAAQVCKLLSPQVCYDYMTTNFHITTLVEDGERTDIQYSSMAVGGMTYGLTTLEMTAAYATFGTNGIYYEPYCYTKVTNSSGSEVLLSAGDDEGERVLSEGTAVVMRELLKSVSSSGTGTPYRVSGQTTFAKTGTTTDSKDRWFVGGTPYYVSAVWYGYDDPEEITVSGNPAGRIFKSVMNEIHEDLKSGSYPSSDEVVSRSYCKATGLLATEKCTDTATGYYRRSYLPSTCKECSASLSTTLESVSGTRTTGSHTTSNKAPTATTSPATSMITPDTTVPEAPTQPPETVPPTVEPPLASDVG